MIEELKEEEVIEKVGGRFKLSTLMQKRLVQLNAGAKPLVTGEFPGGKLSIVMQEIMQDKIYLDASDETLRLRGEGDGMDPQMDPTSL